MTPDAVVLGFAESLQQARSLAGSLGLSCHAVAVHTFPDGEHKLTLPDTLPRHVILHRSLDHPNEKLVDLMFAAKTMRSQGCTRLTLVAPYLCYQRQDIAFAPGEIVSQRIIGAWLAELFDEVITVDAHLHRVTSIAEAVPARRSVNLTAAPLIIEHVRALESDAVLLGPDSESAQWVEGIANSLGCAHGVARKQRRGDREVEITLPRLEMRQRHVILIDDIASSGHTLARAAQQAFAAGAARVDAIVTHALFAPGAEDCIRAAGIANLWSTDSITHPSNAMKLHPLLAAACAPS